MTVRRSSVGSTRVRQLDAIIAGLERGDLIEVESPAEGPQ